MIPRRVQLTPEQRSNKIESDRRRRREHKIEFQRLKSLADTLTDENTRLKEEIERFNYIVIDLQNTVQQQQEQIQRLQHRDEEANQLVASFLNFDGYPSSNGEAAIHESIAGGGSNSVLRDSNP